MDNFDVKKYRLVMGVTQKEFCELIGISQGALAKIEGKTLSVKKYEERIKSVLEKWKEERINMLVKEIEFIKAL